MTHSIYMAGPISGLTYGESEAWRDEFTSYFEGTNIRCLSPLRAKTYLHDAGVLEQSYSHPLSTDRGIMMRDHWDCQRSTLIVCNLIGVERVSIGTVMEIAWAYAYGKPLIMMMDEKSSHDHPMIREAINFRAATVEEAAHIALALL